MGNMKKFISENFSNFLMDIILDTQTIEEYNRLSLLLDAYKQGYITIDELSKGFAK